MATTDYELSPVKFSGSPPAASSSASALPQVIALATGAVVFIAALYAGGPAALYTAPAYLTLAALAVVGVGGRKLIEWVPITGHWVWRKAARQTTYRRGIVKPRPTGTLACPATRPHSRQYEDPESGAVMVHDPHAQTLTAMLEVTHSAFVLMDPGEQERRVHGWGRVLSTVCRSGRIARVQVLERTVPGLRIGSVAVVDRARP